MSGHVGIGDGPEQTTSGCPAAGWLVQGQRRSTFKVNGSVAPVDGCGCPAVGDEMPGLESMNGEKRIQFAEEFQAFLCDEYYRNNFTAFLHANSISVEVAERSDWPVIPESWNSEQLSILKITKESPALKQEIADGLIGRFLAADEENKAQHT
jgi:hypothetical protein